MRRLVGALGGIAWTIAIASVAVVAIGVQMDRQARRSLAVAKMVPAPFRAYALETLARDAYRKGENALGIAYSRALIERRPVPAEGLSLLSVGLLATGRQDAALAPLLLSAQRGWRDRNTQLTMVAAARQVGEMDVATQRLLALWRQGDRSAQTKDLTRSILSDPQGLAKFSGGIVQTEHNWSTEFLVWAGDELPAKAVQTVAVAMAKKNVVVDCAGLSAKSAQLVRFGKAAAGAYLWASLCSNGRVSRSDNFSFVSDGDAGPFDWQFPDQAGLDVELLRDARGVTLRYANSEPLRAIVAKKSSILKPGPHHVRIAVDGATGPTSRPVLLQIQCFSRGGTFGNLVRVRPDEKAGAFSIPATGCGSQELALLVGQGEGRILNMTIEP